MSEALYLIRKGGAYYRPNSQGYTRVVEEAGRYTLEEAIAITHPNGFSGSRDGMDYAEAPAPEKAAPFPALLPCPFCGAPEDRLLCSVEGEDDYFNVGCEECDCRTAWFDSRAAAYTAWNRRADREARPSLPDSREEWDEFNRGYLIAVANVMNMHRDAVVASELLVQLGVTIDDAEALGLTDYDMDALKRLRGEPRAAPFFKRKRRARARQGGNNG